MINEYQTKSAKILGVKSLNPQIKLFRLKFVVEKYQPTFNFIPGQIIELSLPGYGEAPFAPCSSPLEKKYFEICVRRVGFLTERLHQLKKGDKVGIRGPFGNGFREVDFSRPLILVGGGIGLFPLRPLILQILAERKKFKEIQLFYGAREKKELLFQDEYKDWRKEIEVHLTIDKKDKGWKGNVGVITTLFNKIKLLKNAQVIMVGPPVMYKFCVQSLKKLGFKDKDMFLSLERRMECGIGVCQHCAMGSFYVCKDGPVFRYDKIKDVVGAI